MALKITKELKDNRQLAMTVEVDQERVNQEMRKAARKVGNQYRIPGFRKGKAPYNIILQYVGAEALYQEFVDDLGQEIFRTAIEQEEIEPYATASLNDVQFDPLRYMLTVPLDPEVELGDYRSLRIDEPVVEVSDEQLEEALDEYREQYAAWEDSTEGANYGDRMTIDVKSVLTDPAEDENPVVLEENEWEITPDQENPMDPPGFDEQVLGLKAGDSKEFTLSWPEDSQSIYAGRSVNINVTVHKVQSYKQAELTDELAQMIGPDFETVADLRNGVRESLLEQAKQEAESDYLEQAVTRLLEQSTLNYPPAVIEDQLDVMMNETDQRLRQMGLNGLDHFFEMTQQSREDYRDQNREDATRIAERNLVISEIVAKEKLVVSEDELMERIKMTFGDEDPESESAQNMIDMFRDGPGRPIFESQILTQKALDRILAIARGEEIPEPVAEAETVADETASTDTEGAATAEVAVSTSADAAEAAPTDAVTESASEDAPAAPPATDSAAE
ncbi:MAG: trigger factor [Caldilineaceae bacterium]